MSNNEIKRLPSEGLVSVKELAKWLGIRNDKLDKKLNEAGIKTTDLSRNSRFRFVSLADLAKKL
jgi:phage antirepressor YoqD-like protein